MADVKPIGGLIKQAFLTDAFHSPAALFLLPTGLSGEFSNCFPSQPALHCSRNFFSGFARCCDGVFTICAVSAALY